MKKKLNGTRGFLNQITNKIQIDKGFDLLVQENEYSNKKVKNFISSLRGDFLMEKKTNLMLNSYNDQVSSEELNILKSTFEADFSGSDDFHISSRCIIKEKLFHSLLYKRKGLLDSYSVCFNFNKEERFGQIEKFIRVGGKIYAFIRWFPHSKIRRDFPVFDFSNYEIINRDISIDDMFDLFSKYYFKFNEQNKFLTIIPINDIICHCLVVHSKKNVYFTKLAYNFEHD